MKHEFLSPVLASFLTAGAVLVGEHFPILKTTEEVAAEARAATVIVSTGKQVPVGVIPGLGSGVGSGWFINDRGDILTAWHVANEADAKIMVTFADGTKHRAKAVYESKEKDITVLHVDEAVGHKFLAWGDSSQLKIDSTVIEVGNPYNLGVGVTQGVLSIPPRRFPGDTMDAFQHDAATNPGNSGGPIINKKGEVIGMSDAIYSLTGQSAGIAFAVPVNDILSVLPSRFKQSETSPLFIPG